MTLFSLSHPIRGSWKLARAVCFNLRQGSCPSSCLGLARSMGCNFDDMTTQVLHSCAAYLNLFQLKGMFCRRGVPNMTVKSMHGFLVAVTTSCIGIFPA